MEITWNRESYSINNRGREIRGGGEVQITKNGPKKKKTINNIITRLSLKPYLYMVLKFLMTFLTIC